MNEAGGVSGDGGLPADQLRELDRICDRFESAWQSGERPALGEYLAAAPEALRRELLRLLVRVTSSNAGSLAKSCRWMPTARSTRNSRSG